MNERVPSFLLLVPGPWRDASELVAKLARAGIKARARGTERLSAGAIEVRIVEDESLGAAFRFGRRGALPADLIAAIERCGRDAEIAMSGQAAIAWLDMFNLYQLIEDPILVSGQTFRPDEQSPRRVMERWPDAEHAAEDGRYNPFGVFRFLDESVTSRPVSKLVPVITPPLSAILMATESKNGGPLTREQVEQLVEKAPAMMMERAHARALERNRGYADIDPELAWEQWQIVRQSNRGR